MTRTYSYVIVDVFTDRIFGGNQLAVILDAESLSSTEMQAIAREFNFSESTFVLPPVSPGAVKRVRIFTPSFEMPFAGHPTIGTAFVLDHEGYLRSGEAQAEAILDESIGPVVVRIDRGSDTPGLIWMQHRLPQWGPTITDDAAVARMLGLEPDDLRTDLPMQIVSTGVPYLLVGVHDLDAMARIHFDVRALPDVFASIDPAAVFVWTDQTQTEQGNVHCRMFWHHDREVFEDPATGSANGPLGAFLVQYGVVPRAPHVRILSEQGWEMGRPSLITIDVMTDENDITDLWIAGQTVPVARGSLTLPD